MALQKLSPQRLDTSTGIILTPASTPSSPAEGQMYYDSTADQVQFYNGSAWGLMGGGGVKDDDEDTYITAEATTDVDALDFWTAGYQRMTINVDGNVGIGTTSPGAYKLNVNGDIYCNDISTSDIKMCNDRPNHPGNEVDGTKGSWVFQEGDENMYLINKNSGKRYKLKLEEV